jgi:hypothetical protein
MAGLQCRRTGEARRAQTRGRLFEPPIAAVYDARPQGLIRSPGFERFPLLHAAARRRIGGRFLGARRRPRSLAGHSDLLRRRVSLPAPGALQDTGTQPRWAARRSSNATDGEQRNRAVAVRSVTPFAESPPGDSNPQPLDYKRGATVSGVCGHWTFLLLPRHSRTFSAAVFCGCFRVSLADPLPT